VSNAAPLLRADRLSVAFPAGKGWLRAVDEVSFTLAEGETLALVGESGSGKSVTAMAVARLHGPEARVSGQLGWTTRDGEALDLGALQGEALRRLRGRDIAVVFQDPGSALDPIFRVGDQIGETLRHLRGVGRREAAEGAIALLERVGIPDPRRRASEYPLQLSGGMRQRAVIALALAGQPRLLVADAATGLRRRVRGRLRGQVKVRRCGPASNARSSPAGARAVPLPPRRKRRAISP
jgi:ABC-type dipeptide/oligopeptide/nickel transport system ATPase component